MNQHTANTKSARIRSALRKLGRATCVQLSWESDVAVRDVQSIVPALLRHGSAKFGGVANFHHGDCGRFPHIYETARSTQKRAS